MKIKCSRCKEEKDSSSFWSKTKSKNGFNGWCKECCKLSARISNKTPKQRIEGQIRNTIVIENKMLKEDNKRICSVVSCRKIFKLNTGRETRCPKCELEKFNKYKEANREKIRAKQKEYQLKNKEILKAKRKEKRNQND